MAAENKQKQPISLPECVEGKLRSLESQEDCRQGEGWNNLQDSLPLGVGNPSLKHSGHRVEHKQDLRVLREKGSVWGHLQITEHPVWIRKIHSLSVAIAWYVEQRPKP